MRDATDWAARVRAYVAGEASLDALRALAVGDAAREAELAWLDALERHVDAPADASSSGRALVERALAAVDAPPPIALASPRRRSKTWLTAGLATTVLAAGLSWLWLRPAPSHERDERPWSVEAAPETIARLEGRPLASDATLAPGARLEVTRGEACVQVAGASVCAGAEASLSRPESVVAEPVLGAWTGAVRVAWADESGEPLVLDDLAVRARGGAAEVVLASGTEQDGPSATVVRGVLEFAVAGQTWTAVAGETIRWKRPSSEQTPEEEPPTMVDDDAHEDPEAPVERASPSVSADALLTEAQGHRRAGRWKAAARTYRTLIRAHPRSEAARVARVAWADLQLDKLGDPEGAIRNYRRYLDEGGGPLATEVHASLAAAYRKTGAREEERAEIEVLLRSATGARAADLRRRWAELR